jgi:hypothetical protein
MSIGQATAVSVTSGDDIQGVNIRTISGHTFHVAGKLEGQLAQWQGGLIQILPKEEEQMIVAAGASNISPGAFVKSIGFRGTAVSAGEIDMTSEGDAELQVVIRYGTATVSGTVDQMGQLDGGKNKPSTPVHILLIPWIRRADGSDIHFTATDDAN